ncbi:MAG TPA: cytochrome c peroxidase [Candidatus Angelobacter sp.]|nr:cytochrome c peroxidase [Candidatus Angelobacter sp.]
MKRSSGRLAFLRIFVWVVAVVAAVGYFEHVQAQNSGSGSTQTVVIPLRPLAPLSTVPVPPVFGIEGILANKTAAIELGKALFWDMQAGSDDTQACASCHFNAGADSRAINEVNPGQNAGDSTFQVGNAPNYHLNPGTPTTGFGGYHDGDYPFHKVSDVDQGLSIITDANDVTGSQGVPGLTNAQIIVTGGQAVPSSGINSNCQQTSNSVSNTEPAAEPKISVLGGGNKAVSFAPNTNTSLSSTTSSSNSAICVAQTQNLQITVRSSAENDTSSPDPIFSYPDPNSPTKRINTRRVTGRNTPSVVDAVFNYRNFWDGRAQNECNGANPFGSRDGQSHLMVTDETGTSIGPALINMKNSALCSQSLGPILSSTEMSADDRIFPQVGKKLLVRKPLAKQLVDPTDSVLGGFSNAPSNGLTTSYSALVQQAFQPEWWNFPNHLCVVANGSVQAQVNPAKFQVCPSGTTDYSQMEYNFSLFWAVAIQMYESTLVADQTPLDKYLEQQTTYTLIGDNQSNSYTIQLVPGLDPYTVSVISLNPDFDFSDQDIYAFDDGFGRFTGTGVDGTVDYATGKIVVNFEDPPVSTVPVRINYSVGPTPLTQAQLHGLLMFQTKGQCVVCHGGPELSNAAVDTVSPEPLERMIMGDLNVRVYDTGFYHIGVRPGAEDAGLAGADPIAGLPLSNGEFQRERVCNDSSVSLMIPGRPGDGISQSPLNCGDDIARTGYFKVPQLRNVALTAPYFHNGGQLTLEQVVEFYNRGGDFNTSSENQIMDPDIESIGFTLQEKQDLVDFLRNGLTDPRTVAQSAPFDHPQLFAPNGHPVDYNGIPQEDPAHPGQATTQLMEIPAVGKNGGTPLPTFLENLLKNQHN